MKVLLTLSELSGAIDCAEKYLNTIKILALEQTTLRLFRRCWLNLSSNYSALDVIDASKDEKLRDKINAPIDSKL